MYSKPIFLQGVFPFAGAGLTNSKPLSESLSYTVPAGKRAQLIYFRGGNSSPEMIYILLMRDGRAMRYFPVGAKSDTHIALAVVEDLVSGTQLAVQFAAPDGVEGSVVLDIGLAEV